LTVRNVRTTVRTEGNAPDIAWSRVEVAAPGAQETGEIGEVSEVETGEVNAQKTTTFEEARKLLDDAWARSAKAYKEAKEQADTVYEAAKKLAVDKDARKRADEAHDQAVTEAKKVRDAITNVAQSVFTESWKQRDIAVKDALAASKASGDLAQKTYKDAVAQADAVHKAARTQAIDKQAEKKADEARKDAGKQARKNLDEATKK